MIPAVQLAIGLVALAFVVRSRFRPAAGWLATAWLGQVAILQIIRGGRVVGYDRIIVDALLTDDAFWVVVLALQAVAVAVGLWRSRERLLFPVLRALGLPSLLVALVVVAWLSATPKVWLVQWLKEASVRAPLVVIQCAALALAVERMPVATSSFWEGWTQARVRAVCWISALGSAALALFVYEAHPHIPDELAYVFQARTFAEGRLAVGSNGVPEAFSVFMVPCDAARCYSVAAPGWSALLTLGVLVGAGWLVNPLLSGINLLLAHRLFARHMESREAALALALLAASPWWLFTGMSFMQHCATLFFALLAALAASTSLTDARLRWPILAGVLLGALSLIRLQDAAAFAPACALAAMLGTGRVRWTPPIVMTLSTMAVASLSFVYSQMLIGDPFHLPVMQYMDQLHGEGRNALGFGADRGLDWYGLDLYPGHGLADVLANAHQNLFSIQAELFGWAGGSLTLLAVALVHARLTKFDVWSIAVIAGSTGMASLYWFSGGPDFVARYWYPTIIAFGALSARAISWLASERPPELWNRIAAGAVTASLLSLCVLVPWRVMDKYYRYRGFDPSVRELIAEAAPRSLVIVRGEYERDYWSARMYGALDSLGERPLVAHGIDDATTAALLAEFPERKVIYIDGPMTTGDSYRVVSD